VRDDHRLTEVERFVDEQVSYRNLEHNSGPNNIIISDWGIRGIRQIVRNVREGVVSFGLTDVVYYCSDDSETRVRAHVYSQVLLAMQQYLAESNVKIHLFGHSLGVTIVHDFLFGLFKKDHEPDFVKHIREGRGQVQNFKSGVTKRKADS
jgi:hypothetical protein